MRRPNYSAVTGCTAVLVGVCAVRLAFQSLIPPPNPEIAQWGRGDFVKRAQTEDIDWKAPTLDSFQEAQRLSRPLIVVIGLPWSGVGRQADMAFAAPEVARALNRGFVAVRIDGARDPRWLSQFLPLRRTRDAFSVGFQAWVFDLRGRLIDFIARVDARDDLRGAAMLDALLKAQKDFAEAALGEATPALEDAQRVDLARLLHPAVADLSLEGAATTLATSMDPQWGGWNVRDLLPVRPLALRFLQLAGRWNETEESMRLTLLSPRADWLDGGFYRVARKDTQFPEYDKVSVANAQFAEVLAVQDAARPNVLLRKAAHGAANWLASLREDDLVPGAEEGDEDQRGRSLRSSFSPQRLRDAVSSGVISADDRAWGEKELSLGDDSRTIIPHMETLGDPRMTKIINELRSFAGPRRKKVGAKLCDVNGTVAACLLRCARLWGDSDLAAAGGAMVDRLESFQAVSGLRHSLEDAPGTLPYLGDSLSYADAQMADFLTNGRVPSLERGADELRRALQTFSGPAPGVLRSSPTGTVLLRGMPEVPEVADDEREALSAAALRLVSTYAAVLGRDGKDLADAVPALRAQLSGVADAIPAMGGALNALALTVDPVAAFVVGPNAFEHATRLARSRPNRLVVPVLGAAKPELRARLPGVYVSSQGGIAGPLSDEDALRRLPAALAIR